MLHRRHNRTVIAAIAVALVVAALAMCGQVSAQPTPEPNWGIAIHGGAGAIARGSMSPELEAEYTSALAAALSAGHAVLERGGRSVEAVQAAIRLMEDSPLFNAGKGSAFTADGTNELDASVMDGRTGMAGAVASLRRVRNPIDLARLVMEKSPHVLLVGEGAEAFAVEQGMELVPEEYFFTERRWTAWQELRRAAESRSRSPGETAALSAGSTDQKLGTVGAVALDRAGHLAAGTSTGGTNNKRSGRVGDSPIIGAGTYADDRCGAISATGHGEFFIRAVVAYDICAITLYTGTPVRDAADQVVMEKLVRLGGQGGVVAMDPQGVPSFPFNTSGMFRGYSGRDGEQLVAMYRD